MRDGEEVIREIWRRWNAGLREYDPELVDPEIEIHSGLTGRTFTGEAEALEWIAEIDEQFKAWEISIAEVERLSEDEFSARGSIQARGRQSGIALDQPMTWTILLREGRLLRLTNVLVSNAEKGA
jgi:hypothetical protein